MKKNFKKKFAALALVCLFAVGAQAWLVNHEVATGVNNIKVGTIAIEFTDESNAIALTDNNAIPMTKEYAIDNSTIHYFTIHNNGTMAESYEIVVNADGYSNTFNSDAVKLVIAEVAADATDAEVKAALNSANVQDLTASGIQIATKASLAVDANQKYAIVAYVDGHVVLGDYTGKAVSFGLKVNSEQLHQ